MRLSTRDIGIIKDTVSQILPDAQVYLFGSRVDDTKKGGDIDLLVVTKEEASLMEQGRIDWILQEKLGAQHIDILYQVDGHFTTFGQLAKLKSVTL